MAAKRNRLPRDRQAAIPALTEGADVAEYLELPGDPDEIVLTETPDGGAFVDMPGEREESTPPDEGFYANLAERLPDHIRRRIVADLIQRIEEDKESRKPRDKQYEEGIKRTGLGKDAPGGADFEGASRVVHPMMTEACIDYQSRVMKELWPPSGPVKPKILGSVTTEKTERAKRKTEHMNWQTTTQMKEARAVLETTLTQVPLGGSQFIRLWQDHRLKRPRCEFASVDNIHLPANAADFASASRKTFEDKVSAVEFRQRVDAGLYIDPGLPAPSMLDEKSAAETASDKVEGVIDPTTNLDGDRSIYETQTYLDVSEEAAEALGDDIEQAGDLNPYLISIDVSGREMLGMYRNWEEHDPAKEPIEHLFEFPFLPWRGALSIGFPQIIGGLSAAATGALRALLDSAHIANVASGYVLKGAGISGQTRSPRPGELVEVDAGMEADDIRKRILPTGMVQPSPVLFQLLGAVTEMAKGVVRTSLDDAPAGQGNTPVPVGTQMSRVEEGLVVFSAVHGRAHAALDRFLAGLHRLNRLYLPEQVKVDAKGTEIMVRRKDYEGPCDIMPVSDPTIYSDQQRFAQLGYIQSRMMVAPQLWNAREVELAGLRLIKWPDPETLLVAPADPEEANAVVENLNMGLGKGAIVFAHQDHLAHIQAHMDFLKSPALGSNPMIAPAFLAKALPHIAEHILNFYAVHTVNTVEAAARKKVGDLLSNDEDIKGMFDQLLGQASQIIVPEVEQAVSGAMPILLEAFQHLQQLQPKPPMDPALAAVQAAQAETQRKTAADQASQQQSAAELAAKTHLDAAGQQQQAQTDAEKLALQQQANAIQADRVAAIREGQQMTAQTKLATTAADNQTAMDISSAKIESGHGSSMTDGGSLEGQ